MEVVEAENSESLVCDTGFRLKCANIEAGE